MLLGLTILLSSAQTQHIQGQVIDKANQYPIIGANIIINDSNPIIGTTTDADGIFIIEQIPACSITLICSSIGYQTFIIKNVLLTSGKAIQLIIELEEQNIHLQEIIVGVDKKSTSNILFY